MRRVDIHPVMIDAPSPCQPRRPRPECTGCARFWAPAAPNTRSEGVDHWQPVLDVAAVTWWADACPMRTAPAVDLREAA